MIHNDELRAWAKDAYTTEAATELLIRAFGGRFASLGKPWVKKEKDTENAWINFEQIPDRLGGLSGGERRLLLLAASIAEVDFDLVLGDVLPGLDRPVLDLVLAAVAHAGGSHEHSDLITNTDGTDSIRRLSSLYPWPNEG
ncbi:hypothetical protein AL755_04210 [Arthrobacter sp. ERGS1:01]|uniref:hypothetical protein n=1 Tax=Arthrobacter sp. ERGS1:01 TaxID=1704044 RepID=UPI0006B45E5C|nr:hypothetical protein [Arthrobacter sp. ERGS1:01]ALE04889.1 hypothetical protein AL755_04210 [Arthrobacter sp. ERGS1:01]